MEEDDACEHRKGRILLIRQDNRRIQQGHLETQIRMA